MLRLSRICVPICSIFLRTVLWAAIDIQSEKNGAYIIVIIVEKKSY